MKHKIVLYLIVVIFSTINTLSFAQHYSQNQQLQADTEDDTGEKRTVFSFSLYGGLNNALMSKEYVYEVGGYIYNYTAYPMNGLIVGTAWKFHLGTFYNLGLEALYSIERFDIEETGNILKTSYIETFIVSEMNFTKSIAFLFGPEMHFGLPAESSDIYNYSSGLGFFLGAKYNHQSGLFASVRYKLNLTNYVEAGDIYINNWYDGEIEKYADVSIMQFTLGYTIPLVKKSKKKKKVKPVETDYYRPPVVTEEAKPVKPDYSEYSNGRLNELLEEFLKKEDYENAKFVQEELDKRNIGSEYENMSLDKLKKLLEEALSVEDYEKAAVIQRIIDEKNK